MTSLEEYLDTMPTRIKVSATPLLNKITEKMNSDKGYDNHHYSFRQLTQIVTELIKSNNKLRSEVAELKRWVQVKKRKIVIVDWLNENYQINENYKEFVNKIVVTSNLLEIIFQTNLIEGIQRIFEEYMSKMEDQKIPFKSFDQKSNTIYVYNEESKWEVLSSEDFNNIVSILSKKILVEFKIWQDKNQHQLYTDDFSVIYIQNTKKIIGGDIPLEKLRRQIHINLYKYLKMNLQNTIEYEFS
tara:strand:+ start:972 stop:1700 length:729 start_codon:yes stop_codon:yes gene_type:complete